jgi:hypothetical protein
MNMNDLTKVTSDKEVIDLKSGIAIIERDATELVVADQNGEVVASDLRSQIKNAQKKLKAKLDFYVAPEKEYIKSVQDMFKVHTVKLDNIDGILEDKMIAFHAKLEEEKRKLEIKQQAKIEKAIEKGKPIPVVPIVKVDTNVRSESGQTVYMKVWTFEILDDRKVPRDYCLPAPTLIREAVKQGIRNIDGVRIFEDTITQRR